MRWCDGYGGGGTQLLRKKQNEEFCAPPVFPENNSSSEFTPIYETNTGTHPKHGPNKRNRSNPDKLSGLNEEAECWLERG